MLSLNDLSIEPNWRVREIGSQTAVGSLPGNIFIGWGGFVKEGVLDAQDTPYKSAAELLFQRRELVYNHLLRGLNENHQSGLRPQIQQLELTFCYKNLNWDALCCYVLCDHLVRTGEFPNWARELVESANAVNQGEAILDDKGSAPFALFYALTNQVSDIDLQTVFPKGKDLVEDIAQLRKSEPRSSTNTFLCPILDKQRYSELIASNQQDYEHFINDFHSGHKFEMQLPCSEEGNPDETRNAKVLFIENVPQSRLFIYWGRAHFDLMVYQKQETSSEGMHWSFSIQPKRGFSLRGLGYHFEKFEATNRKDRKGLSRWGDDNYSDNNDPWYDGRNHQYCLVESPRSGTKISTPDEIKQLLQSDWHSITLGGTTHQSHPVHFTFFYFVTHDASKEDKSESFWKGWNDWSPFYAVSSASKILKEAHFKVYDSGSYGCTFYTSEVSNSVLVAVTPKVRKIKSMEEIPSLIKEVRSVAQNQLLEAIKKLPEFPRIDFSSFTKVLEANKESPELQSIDSFIHVSVSNPDLRAHSDGRIKETLISIKSALRGSAHESTASELFQVLKDGNRNIDLIDLSSCITILFDQAEREIDSVRYTKKMFILYALFIKSCYQQFSQKLKPIPDSPVAEEKVLAVQKRFSRFLTDYDFVATELSADSKIVDFAKDLFEKIYLEEQKRETVQEMKFHSDLSNSLSSKKQREFTNKMQIGFCALAGLSLCDFLYGFLDGLKQQKVFPYELLREPYSTYLNGTLAFLLGLATGLILILAISKFPKLMKRFTNTRESS
jgi:hypothetical protein